LHRLSSAGHIEENGNLFVATERGLGELGSNFEPLPTGDALREHWRQNLPDGERKVFEVVIGAYPEAIDRESIGEQTEYLKSTRNAYIHRLKVRKLVSVVGGNVRAAEDLFS
jgi:hypothetical protein